MIFLFVACFILALLPLAALSVAIALVWVFAVPLWIAITVTVIAGVLILGILAYYIVLGMSGSTSD